MRINLKQVSVVAVMALGASPLFGSAILSQSFTTATAAGWTLQGSASLTAATIDPSGSGWLRLNSSTANSTGFAYTNAAMSLANGLDIKFQFDNWGSGNTGTKGFSMVLFDGSVAAPVAGAAGALGFGQ